MTDRIKSMLADRYLMFYHGHWPLDRIRPVADLDQSLRLVNQAMETHGRHIADWNYGLQDEAGRLVRINWIYQRLHQEPIRKPVLVHIHGPDLVVDCGDTRLMVLDLAGTYTTIGVIATCSIGQAQRFHGWHPVCDTEQLIDLCGFLPDAQVHVRPTEAGSDHACDWLEIGDRTTDHHLHDLDQRVRMLQNWLDAQDTDFQFDRSWAKTAVDWESLDRTPVD